METLEQNTHLGMSDFCAAVGYSESTIRRLELMGILNPSRTRAGWRVFGDADVEAVKAWREAQNSK